MNIKTVRMINKACVKVNSIFDKTIKSIIKIIDKIFTVKSTLAIVVFTLIGLASSIVYSFIIGDMPNRNWLVGILSALLFLTVGQLELCTRDYPKKYRERNN